MCCVIADVRVLARARAGDGHMVTGNNGQHQGAGPGTTPTMTRAQCQYYQEAQMGLHPQKKHSEMKRIQKIDR